MWNTQQLELLDWHKLCTSKAGIVSLPIHQFHQQSRHKYSLSFENWLPLAEKIKNLPCHGIRRKLKLWCIFDSGSFEYFLHLNFDRPAVENSRFDEIAGLWFWKSFWLLGTKLILRTNFCYNEVLRRLTNDGRANNRNIETPYKKILIMSFKITTQHVTINNIPNKRSWNIVFLVCWAMMAHEWMWTVTVRACNFRPSTKAP